MASATYDDRKGEYTLTMNTPEMDRVYDALTQLVDKITDNIRVLDEQAVNEPAPEYHRQACAESAASWRRQRESTLAFLAQIDDADGPIAGI